MLKTVVVGAGSISREFALRHLVEELGVVVVAVVDTQLELAESLARDVSLRRAGACVIGDKYRETADADSIACHPSELPVVLASTSLESVLAEHPIDLCYIGTPPNTHAKLAVAALRSDKHVLLEKPIAVSDEDAEAICQEAEAAWLRSGCVVSVNIGMRFSEAALEMRRRIASHDIGQVASLSLRLLFRQWPREWQKQPWVAQRAQGGPLLEVGTHWFFGLLEIMDVDRAEVVDCHCVYDDGPEGLLCETSCVGSLLLLPAGAVARFEVQTASHEASAEGKDIYELHAYGEDGKSLVLYDFSKLRDGVSGKDLVCGSYGRRECVEEIVKAIRAKDRGAGNLVTVAQAQQVQRLLAAIRKST